MADVDGLVGEIELTPERAAEYAHRDREVCGILRGIQTEGGGTVGPTLLRERGVTLRDAQFHALLCNVGHNVVGMMGMSE